MEDLDALVGQLGAGCGREGGAGVARITAALAREDLEAAALQRGKGVDITLGPAVDRGIVGDERRLVHLDRETEEETEVGLDLGVRGSDRGGVPRQIGRDPVLHPHEA
ncbi:MAG: hypothetical protein ACKOYP_02055, partial [Bacteroidota bacterium]